MERYLHEQIYFTFTFDTNKLCYNVKRKLQTSVANIIANICKQQPNLRFVKLSATMCGINDVKEVVKVAKNEVKFKRQTVLFMDEIHR